MIFSTINGAKHILAVACITSLLLLIIGCGGGTTGTGGTGSSEFSGKVFDEAGAPVANAVVTIEETGDSAVTDQSGSFVIESEVETEAVTINVQSDNNNASTTVDQIPAGAQEVRVDLELDRKKNTVGVKDRVVRPRNKPTPVPTAAPVESQTPVPNPTQTVETPQATPANTPAVTATPQEDQRTLFIGSVRSKQPKLLEVARVGLAGKQLELLGGNGGFAFRAPASDANTTLEVRAGVKSATLSLPGVSANTKRVAVLLNLELLPDKTLSFTLISIKTQDF